MSEKIVSTMMEVLEEVKPGSSEFFELSKNLSDLKLDSLDIINFYFEIEGKLNVKIEEEDVAKLGLNNLSKLKEYLEKSLG